MQKLVYTVKELIEELGKFPENFLVAATYDYEITGEMTISLYNPDDLINEAFAINLTEEI